MRRFSTREIVKQSKHMNTNTYGIDNGDCDAAIAKAYAAVTPVQSLSQEVDFRDERLGLFGFDLSSAETDVWWLEEEQEEEGRLIHNIDLGTVAAEAGGSGHHGSGQTRVFSIIFLPTRATRSGERARFVGLFQECTGLWTAGCWLARRLHQFKASTTMDLGISIFLISVQNVWP